jgi:hypothetical protein
MVVGPSIPRRKERDFAGYMMRGCIDLVILTLPCGTDGLFVPFALRVRVLPFHRVDCIISPLYQHLPNDIIHHHHRDSGFVKTPVSP